MINRIRRWRKRKQLIKQFGIRRAEMMENNTIEIVAKHPLVAVLSEELVKYFIETGASNYVQMDLWHQASRSEYSLLLQKGGRPSPLDVNAKMRTALERILETPERANVIAAEVLTKLGYLKDGQSHE